MASAAPPRTSTLATLEPGDHLTPEEFRRRYEQRHDIRKAELIFGVVYMPSPARHRRHGAPHTLLVTQLGAFWERTPGVQSSTEGTVRFEDGSEVQPDVLLRYEGGSSTVGDDDYIYGPPELAAEVAASSATYDLHVKKELYRRMGVQEYLVWRTEDEAIDWWQLKDGDYVPIEPDERGVLRSVAFPGLELDVPRLLALVRQP